jgi:PST family polysaccharide transporter
VALATEGARGAVQTLASQVVIFVARFAGLVILARLLSPEVFGRVAIATAIVTLATMVVQFGLPMAIVQAPHLSQAARSSLFWVNTVVGLVVALALVGLSGPIALVYGDPMLQSLLTWFALVPFIMGVQMQSRMHLIGALKFGGISLAEAATHVLAVALSVVIALLGHPYLAAGVQMMAQPLFQGIAVMVIARWLPGRTGAWATEVREVVVIGLRLFGGNFLRAANRWTTTPVLGLYLPAAQVGSFDRAMRLAVLPVSMTVTQLQRVAVPVLARLRDSPAQLERFMLRAQTLNTYGTAAGLAVVAALGEPLTRVVLGDAWDEAGTALRVLAVGTVFQALALGLQWLFIGAGKTSTQLKLAAVSQPLIAVATLAGIPWGIVGVSVGYSIAWAVWWPIYVVVAVRSVGIDGYRLLWGPLRALMQFAVPVGLGAFLATLLGASDLVTLIIGVAGACLMAAASFLIFTAVRSDLRKAWSLVREVVSSRNRGRQATALDATDESDSSTT